MLGIRFGYGCVQDAVPGRLESQCLCATGVHSHGVQNQELVLEGKLQNLMSLDYPKNEREIIVF